MSVALSPSTSKAASLSPILAAALSITVMATSMRRLRVTPGCLSSPSLAVADLELPHIGVDRASCYQPGIWRHDTHYRDLSSHGRHAPFRARQVSTRAAEAG